MSLTKALKGRSYEEFREDPNFEGAFAGGPPLFSTKQLQAILKSDTIEDEAKKAYAKAKERFLASRANSKSQKANDG